MSIQVPSGAQEDLEGSLQDGGVRLPFDVGYFFVRNGNKNFRAQGGVGFFGGFGVLQEQLDEVLVAQDQGDHHVREYDGLADG